jgi:tRNA (guanine-N7-)-methyltransferase
MVMTGRFYGRLKTRALSQRQVQLFHKLQDKFFISSLNKFLLEDEEIFLEIGFGSGEHIAQLAMQNPNKIFIGCEPFLNGVASLLVKIDENNIENIFIFQGDAKILIKESPDNFFSGVFLLFPDPWPKRKHAKRRFVQEETIVEINRILKKGMSWKIASDHPEYKKWILKNFTAPHIQNLFSYTTFDNKTRPDEIIWPETRYETKATNDILYLIIVKN